MRWQDKVRRHLEDRGITMPKLAGRIGVKSSGFSGAMGRDSAWGTVQTAIRLAREMGTTVEYLFDPDTGWPPYESSAPSEDVARMAIEALERLGATDELAKLAALMPREPHQPRRKKPKKKPKARPKKAKGKKS